MGCGIALEFAIAGRQVTLFNTRPESSAQAQARMERDAALLVETGLLSSEKSSAALGRIQRTTVLAEAAADQDFVIESVPEDLALNQQVFRELDRLAAPGTLLASNTTALSVTVVFARDVPGSVGPRLQQALMGEALRLVQEGVATPEMVDRVLTHGIGRRFGVTGIFDRLDLAGLDLVAALMRGSGRPVPPVVAQKVERGEFGLKSGQGAPWPSASPFTDGERARTEREGQLSSGVL